MQYRNCRDGIGDQENDYGNTRYGFDYTTGSPFDSHGQHGVMIADAAP
jgi:hypothetical protein